MRQGVYKKYLLQAFTLFNFIRPFLVGCGSDTSKGYAQIHHRDLCSFYKLLIDDLKALGDKVIPASTLLRQERLPFLSGQFKELGDVSAKVYRGIKKTI